MIPDSFFIQYVIIQILIAHEIKQNCVKMIIRMFAREINNGKRMYLLKMLEIVEMVKGCCNR